MVVVAVGGGAVWGATRPGPADPWAGSRLVSGAPPLAFTPALDRYRVTYRVEVGRPLGKVDETETLSVNRPFDSHLVTEAGPPPGGKLISDQTGTIGRLRTKPASGDAATVLSLPPDLAANDLRLDVALPQLLAGHVAERREQREVIGRRCQVYRTSTPPQGTNLAPLTPGGPDRVDSCVAADGVLLQQLRFSDGQLISRRTAASVDEHPQFAPGEFTIDEPVTITPDRGGGNVAAVDPSVLPPGMSWLLDAAPDGFQFAGHFAVAEAQPANPVGPPVGERKGGFTDVYLRGPDVLLLDQGGSLFSSDPFPPSPLATPVDLGALGQGEAIPGPRLSSVRIALARGRYVRLAGTLPVERLAEIARSLRPVDHP